MVDYYSRGSMAFRLLFPVLLAASPLLLPPTFARADFDDVIDSPMYKAPDLPGPKVVYVLPEKWRDPWLKALARPDADTKCKAADAIAAAYRRGMKGLETTIPPLLKELDQPDQHPTVRLAIAKALVTLDARDAASSLREHATADGREMRDAVEPALAHWDYRPARAVWLERIRDGATPQRSLVLAIRQLGEVREEQAAGRLREITLSDRLAGPIRLEAARALGAIRGEGLEKDAENLAGDPSPAGIVARLAAASLLHRHQSKAATELLQRLMEDKEPTVATVALARLIEIDPALTVPAIERLLANADANVRSLAVEVLQKQPSEKHIGLLGEALDDDNLHVRRQARRALYELAGKPEHRDAVIAVATKMLATTQWRGLEQATILLTQLDHKPAANRFVQLLKFERPEVFVSAAWGLRTLDVAATLPDVQSQVDADFKRITGALPPNSTMLYESLDHELSQLNQFLGRRKYEPADSVLRKFVPKRGDRPMIESRSAAIWALGMIHEGKQIDDLATALEARLNDVRSIPPEMNTVRRMSAVTLGRIKATAAVPSLQKFWVGKEPSGDPASNACGWALEKLTGEVMPPPKTIKTTPRDWFLTPID